jgi:septum site-determining protein MinC
MRESVIFKGDRDGLQLMLNASAEFGVIIDQLKNKLASGANFFASGAKVHIVSDNGDFSLDEQKQLIELLEDYGLCYNNNNAVSAGKNQQPVKTSDDFLDGGFADSSDFLTEQAFEDNVSQILTVPKMLRGGQKLIYSGTVIVKGNVNPSAQIIAGGDIVVHGTCWGLVHAGAFGDNRATIMADRLVAAQLRIAEIIARAPDAAHNPQHPEKARIFKGKLIIEPIAGVDLTAFYN